VWKHAKAGRADRPGNVGLAVATTLIGVFSCGGRIDEAGRSSSPRRNPDSSVVVSGGGGQNVGGGSEGAGAGGRSGSGGASTSGGLSGAISDARAGSASDVGPSDHSTMGPPDAQRGADGGSRGVAVDASDSGATSDASTDGGSPCPSNETLCGAECKRTQSDPANCGGCDKTCGSAEVCRLGVCTGSCEPYLRTCGQSCVVSDSENCGGCGIRCSANAWCRGTKCNESLWLGRGWSLILHEGILFWYDLDSDAIVSAHADGSGGAVVVSGVGQLYDLAVDSANVYWTAGDTVKQAPLAGGPAIVLASGQDGPAAIASDGERVYWTNSGALVDSGSVASIAVGGGSTAVLASSQGRPYYLSVDATSVYWGNNIPSSSGFQIGAVPKAGGTIVGLVTSLPLTDEVSALFQLGSALFFATQSGLFSVPASGGRAAPISTVYPAFVSPSPHALYVDARSVYWISSSSLYDVAGHIASFKGPGSLAGDENYLYIVDGDGIWRVVR
jgi:hypothetical protein